MARLSDWGERACLDLDPPDVGLLHRNGSNSWVTTSTGHCHHYPSADCPLSSDYLPRKRVYELTIIFFFSSLFPFRSSRHESNFCGFVG